MQTDLFLHLGEVRRAICHSSAVFFATTQELQHKGLMAKPDKSEVVPDDAAQKKVKPGEKVVHFGEQMESNAMLQIQSVGSWQ